MIQFKHVLTLFLLSISLIPAYYLLEQYIVKYQQIADTHKNAQTHSSLDYHFIVILILSNSQTNAILFYLCLLLVFVYLYIGYMYLISNKITIQYDQQTQYSLIFYFIQISCLFIAVASNLMHQNSQNGFSFFIRFNCLLFLLMIHQSTAKVIQDLLNIDDSHSIIIHARLLFGIFIIIFLDFELIAQIDFANLTKNLSPDSSGWALMPSIWAYLVLKLPLITLDHALIFIVHFYNFFTHPLSNNIDESSEPNYVQLQNQLKIKVHLKYYIFWVKIIMMGALWASMAIGISPLFYFGAFTTGCEINKNLKLIKKYSSVMRLSQHISQKTLDSWKYKIQNQKIDPTCTICFWNITSDFILLDCGHLFHKYCLEQWVLRNKNQCVKCKKPIDVASYDNRLRNYRETRQKLRALHSLDTTTIQQQLTERPENKVLKTKEELIKASRPIFEMNLVKRQNYVLASNRVKPIKEIPVASRKNIGSLPFGLPKQAVYQRNKSDMKNRMTKIMGQNKLIKLMEMTPAKQLLMVPQL